MGKNKEFNKVVNGIRHGSLQAKYIALRDTRQFNLLPHRDTANKIMPKLLELSKCESRPYLQFEAVALICRISGKQDYDCQNMIRLNVHKVLIDVLMSSPYYAIQQYAYSLDRTSFLLTFVLHSFIPVD